MVPTVARALFVLFAVATLIAGSVIAPAAAQESTEHGLTDDGAEVPMEASPDAPVEVVVSPTTPPALPTATPAPLAASDVAARASNSLVQVRAGDKAATGYKVAAGVLTNEHVVRGADSVQLITVDVRRGSGKVVTTDGTADLALVITDLELPALDLEPSRSQPLGAELLVLGFPRPDAIGGSPTLTRGLLSACRTDDAGHLYVQTDAAINSGSSGSPLLSARGTVLGVVAFKIVDSQGLNFAVASDTIEAFLKIPWAIRPPAPTPTATPVATPTLTPLQRDCASAVATLPVLTDAVQKGATAQARNDYAQLRSLAANLRARTYPALILPMVNALLRVLDWSAASAETRANWPLFVLTAGQAPNGYLLLAAAEADLNRADGEARAADLDFESATRQFRATCAP